MDRAINISRTVSALGWPAARELGRGTWSGWRADFLVAALVLIAEAERDSRIIEQAGLWRGLLSPRGPME